MASTSSAAPLPSPAPTLPTPHFPGDFPVTPSPSVYQQTEGPLEAAGRNLDDHHTHGSAGPVAFLGAAAGLLVGGVGGALAGASLFGTAKIEDEALREKGLKGQEKEIGSSGHDTPKVSEAKGLAPESSGVTGGAGPGPAGIAPASVSGPGGGEFVALDFPVDDRAKTPTPPSATPAASAAPEPIHGVVHTNQPSTSTPTAGETLHRKEEAALAGVTGVAAGAPAVIAAKDNADPPTSENEPIHGIVHTTDEPSSEATTAGEALHDKETAALAGVTGVAAGAAAVMAAKDELGSDQSPSVEPVHSAMSNLSINDQEQPNAAFTPSLEESSRAGWTDGDAALREAGIELRPAIPVKNPSRQSSLVPARASEPVSNAMRHRDQNDNQDQSAGGAAGLAVPTEGQASPESPGIQTAAGVAFFDGDHLLPDDVKEMLQQPAEKVTTTTDSTTTHHYHQLEPVVHNRVIHHHYVMQEEDGVPMEVDDKVLVPVAVANEEPVVHNPPTAIDKGKGKEIFDGREVAEVAGLSAGAEAINEYLENRDELAAQAGITPAKNDIPTRDFAKLSVNEEQPTPREALETGLASSAPLRPSESGSRFYEELDGARRPNLTSHFSDVTVGTAANTAPPTPAVAAGKVDPFSTQRIETGNLHEVVPGPTRKTALSDLNADAIPVAAAGFAVADGALPQTQAQADFAHLSSPATSSPVAAVSPVDPEGAASTARLESEYVPLAAGAGLAGIGAGSAAYAEAGEDRPDDNWSTRAIPPDSPAVTPGVSNTPPMTPRGPKAAGLRENVLVGSLAPTADDLNSGVNTPSSTRASRGSPPPLVGQQTFLDESRVQSEEDYAPSSPVQRSNGHSRQSSIDRAVHRSPHLGVATRADSIGHNRLVKRHVKAPADELARAQHQRALSPTSSPRAGSPAQVGSPARSISPVVAAAPAQSSPVSGGGGGGRRRSGSAGADLWDHSVANVVNEETAHRHGQRPQLVTIPSEDRRDSVLDRFAGVPDPTRTPTLPRSQQRPSGGVRAASPGASQRHAQVAPAIPPVHGSPTQGPPVSGEGHHGPNKLRRKSSVAREEKAGVFARMFGHKKSASNAGSEGGSPRASGEFARA